MFVRIYKLCTFAEKFRGNKKQYKYQSISMKNTPIPAEIVDKKVAESGISSVGKASIREVKRLIN